MLLETIVKEEEKRVFFRIGGKQPRDGEPRETLLPEQAQAEAIMAKLAFEKKTGHKIHHFVYDPMAGGSKPRRDPGGQVVKRGLKTDILGNVLEIVPPQNLDYETTEMVATGLWTGVWV